MPTRLKKLLTTVTSAHHAKFWRGWTKNWGRGLSPLTL